MVHFSKLQVRKQYFQVFNIVTAIFLLIVLFGCGTPGSSIVTGNVRPAIDPTEVKIYLSPPAKYETIAIVESSYDARYSSQTAQNKIMKELKKQAAKLGANGVLLTNTGTIKTGGNIYTASNVKTAQGEAIYVTQE